MHGYQRIIRALLSWRYLAMVVVPLNLIAVVPVLFAHLGLGMIVLVLAGANLLVVVTPCVLDRTDFIEGPFNHGNPENQ